MQSFPSHVPDAYSIAISTCKCCICCICNLTRGKCLSATLIPISYWRSSALGGKGRQFELWCPRRVVRVHREIPQQTWYLHKDPSYASRYWHRHKDLSGSSLHPRYGNEAGQAGAIKRVPSFLMWCLYWTQHREIRKENSRRERHRGCPAATRQTHSWRGSGHRRTDTRSCVWPCPPQARCFGW